MEENTARFNAAFSEILSELKRVQHFDSSSKSFLQNEFAEKFTYLEDLQEERVISSH